MSRIFDRRKIVKRLKEEEVGNFLKNMVKEATNGTKKMAKQLSYQEMERPYRKEQSEVSSARQGLNFNPCPLWGWF